MSKLRANQIVNKASTGAPTAPNGLVVTGVSTATSFSGSGANLTSIPAGNLTGTVADARISSLTASKLTGALPAISGANLTGIDSSKVKQTVYNSTTTTFQSNSSSFVQSPCNITITPTVSSSGILKDIFYFDKTMSVSSNTTVNPPASASTAYTHFTEVKIEDGVELTIEDGDALVIDVLGLDPT